ncbi:MAG: glutathione transferase GstA [Myxococcota bacterium]
MKLFYKPGACSQATHIALREAELHHTVESVDTAAQRTASGEDYRTINPKGVVPALKLDSGEVLTEGAAILQFVADLRPESELAPAAGTMARTRLQESLNFLSSEVHKSFGPFFAKDGAPTERDKAHVHRQLQFLEDDLADGRAFLLGDAFTVADAYAFVVVSWTKPAGIPLTAYPHLKAFLSRVRKRPAVREALRAEGLLR